MRVHLGGHLDWYDPQRRAWLDVPAPEAISLRALCELLHVPPEEIGVAAINGAVVDIEQACAADGDTVEFYSPIGGGALQSAQ